MRASTELMTVHDIILSLWLEDKAKVGNYHL